MSVPAVVENAIREVLARKDVRSYETLYGRDSTGEESIWVYVTLAKDATDLDTRNEIRDLLRGTIGQTDFDWVYVRFRTEGEVAERL